MGATEPVDSPTDNSPRRPMFVESPAMVLLLVLALGYTMYFAAFLLMPIAFAYVISAVLMPVVRFLRREMFIPIWLGAALMVLAILLLPAVGIYGLVYPGAQWFTPGIEKMDRAMVRIDEFLEPFRQVRAATERIADIAAAPDGEEPVVRVRDPGFAGALLDWTQGFIVTAAIIIVLVYFMLATDALLIRKMVAAMPTRQEKHRAMEIADRVQSTVSQYLLTITVVNALLGIAVGLAMWALGMPSPLLWGVLAALLNYIPYIGALAGVALAGLVALVAFDSVPYAILVALIYYALTGIEGNFVIPAILGKRLYLNPVVVFIGLLYWGWVWGIPGALLAVPLLSAIKIVADSVKPLNPLGEVLGR